MLVIGSANVSYSEGAAPDVDNLENLEKVTRVICLTWYCR